MVDAAECDSDIEELRESYGSLQMLTADETGDHLLQSDSPAEGLTTRCWALTAMRLAEIVTELLRSVYSTQQRA